MATKNKKITKEEIISKYMDYVLEHEKEPKTVYKFCKQHEIPEADFYKFFASIPAIKKGIWNTFFTNTLALMKKNKDYESFANRDKLLTFFYTFFEMLTLNRSYALFTLNQGGNQLKNMEQLKGLRKHLKEFAKELIADGNQQKTSRITKHNPSIFSEGAWLQLLFLLKFWTNDESQGFEKTDLAIEKSVNTVFDLFDNTPLDNLVDFGKFLYKETFA
ncbi:TetR family transcriptional regulator C-terminal domain-containing protein [Maribacter sp. 4G9]|uniref:TetR family transcriptional regulator C-terminal domain-containing protein n=1 Tax=Maribacter sp. 4G9 TaxID=1889777 RepID=UPI000C1597AE|nr:TetR family transcriptional regulator C-terminal domain-containing protein [Maribacter sp. 4G9]PIB29460.1 heat-shock protein [Maribacter sp. 4G9]